MTERSAKDRRALGAIVGGRAARTLPLAALSARTAGEAVVVGLRKRVTGADGKDFHVRTAERYAELLGDSKGAMMKAGQMMSFVSVAPAVPSEFQGAYRAALARLRDSAPPMAPELAREVVEAELGRPVESVFAQFEWTPLAAASIGQVHAARLRDGRAVAVKVQYPGVAAAIDSDLKNTDVLFTFLRLMLGLVPGGLNLDMRAAAEEFRARIEEELDYRIEASNQTDFAERYRGHPFIRVPAVIAELSTERVLTQELAQGKAWSEAVEASQELRDGWAEAIFRFFYEGFHSGVCNIDLHPGNFVFHDDGTLSCLDFGSVKRFDDQQVRTMSRLIRACLRGDVDGTWRAGVEGGFIDPSTSVTPQEVFDYWHIPYEMYWGEQPFKVTHEFVAANIERRYGPTGPSAKVYRSMTVPRDYTIMSRADMGIWSLMAGLGACNYWGSMADENFEGAPPLTPLGKLNAEFFAGRESSTRDERSVSKGRSRRSHV